jgi:hypothetical protein
MGGKPGANAPRVTHGNAAFLPLKMSDMQVANYFSFRIVGLACSNDWPNGTSLDQLFVLLR